MIEHIDKLISGGQIGQRKKVTAVDAIGQADGFRTADEHYAPVGGKKNGTINLRDAIGIDADIARDGLFGRVCACGGDLQCPNTVRGEGI